jgi:hypothetical protein
VIFKTKKLADLEAERLKSQKLRWGSEGRSILADTAADAKKATAILAPFGVTLVEVANRYAEEMKARSESKTFSEILPTSGETQLKVV